MHSEDTALLLKILYFFLFHAMKCFSFLFLTIPALNQLPGSQLQGYPTGCA